MTPLHATLFDAVTANGASEAINVATYSEFMLSLFTSGSASGTIKFVGSIQKDKPNFGSAKSATNRWDYLQTIKFDEGTAYDGNTGVVMAGTDVQKIMEVNASGMQWIGCVLSSRTAGTYNVHLVATKNK